VKRSLLFAALLFAGMGLHAAPSSASAPAAQSAMPASSAQPTRDGAEKDPVLRAMLTELDRSMSQLHLEGFAKPFFIEYRIDDVEGFRARAEFGASLGSAQFRRRAARVTVHVGDYKTDSSGRGDSVAEIEVVDNDEIALRSALWVATDNAYKAALTAYAQKQAALKQVQTPPQADDLSHEKPVIVLEEPKTLAVDPEKWERLVAHTSGLFLTDPSLEGDRHSVEYSNADFGAVSTTSYLVNSEGTITRTSQTRYDQDFAVGGQAADGMSLDRTYQIAGDSLSDMDAEDAFDRHAMECIKGLAELRAAPLVDEEYHGPVLLEANAAAVTLKDLLGRSFAAERPGLGTEARTTGPFASSYHARVLPDFMDVVDDPLLDAMNGKGLVGAYTVDQEGVPAESVQLVDDGKLENYLIGREPVKDFPRSNGHGRAGMFGPAQPAIGVLKITAKDGLSDEELNGKLLAMAKDRGLAYVYVVAEMAGTMNPRLLYKVTPDGRRTLVRGARLEDLDLRALRSGIEAAGKDLSVNNQIGGVPESVLAPAVLFDDITVRRANEKNEKLPFYQPPE
jgi:predicted Zn-dependent protease